MFTEISWNSYITIVIVLLAVYYLFIGLRYYRADILQLVSRRKFTQTLVGFTSTQAINPCQSWRQEIMQEGFEKQDYFQLAQSLSDEIRAYLNEAARNKTQKYTALTSLKILFGKYPSIKDSPFRDFIQHITQEEFETNCSVRLNEEELIGLWN